MEIKIGSQWTLIQPETPWKAQPVTVEILDVQSGWVRYWMNEYLPDNRKRVDEFLELYKPAA